MFTPGMYQEMNSLIQSAHFAELTWWPDRDTGFHLTILPGENAINAAKK
jgi:hypothetical protein